MPKVNRPENPSGIITRETCVANTLHPKHLAKLRESKLTDGTIELCQAYTEYDYMALVDLLMNGNVEAPALVFPGFDRDGCRNHYYHVRFIPPLRFERVDKNCEFVIKEVKYLNSLGSQCRALFPPLPCVQDALHTKGSRLGIVEGWLKALYLSQCGFPTIALMGMNNWNKKGSRELIKDLAEIAAEHSWLLIPDFDDCRKTSVNYGTSALAQALSEQGAPEVGIAQLPWRVDARGNYIKCAVDDMTPEAVGLQVWPKEIIAPMPLHNYRDEMTSRRLAIIGESGIFYDGSPTGSGKNYTDREVVRRYPGIQSLTLVPTHCNAGQVVHEFQAENILDAAAYPNLKHSCQRWDEAEKVIQCGFTVRNILCPECPCQGECEYNSQYMDAASAQHSVATHKRGEVSMESIGEGKAYISGHECMTDTIRPTIECEQGFLSVELLAKNTSFSGQMPVKSRRRGDHVFFDTMAKIARQLHNEVESLNPVNGWSREVPLPTPAPTIPDNFERQLWRTMNNYKIPCVRNALQMVIACTCGKADNLMGISSEIRREGGEVELRTAIHARLSTPLPGHGTIIFNDATGNRSDLEAMLGRPVQDITPAGNIAPVHPIIQIPRDVTRSTVPGKAADILRGLLYDLPYQRIGVITHRPLETSLATLVGTPFSERIVEIDHFSGGEARGSNKWFQRCDCLIVLGTPRVPTFSIAKRLIQINRIAASALRPEAYKWSADWWSGVTQSGKRVTVKTKHYQDHDWHRAHHAIVVAELIQNIGRARSYNENGIPCYVVTTENLAPLEKGIDGRHSIARIADKPFAPLTEAQMRVLSVMGDKPMSGRAIARAIGLSQQTVNEHLSSLQESGCVRLLGRMKGWEKINPCE